MPAAVSIVVVTHRGVGELVRSCLASISESAADAAVIDHSTIVVDNSGGPAVAPEAYGPAVTHVVRVDNRGFGAAANAGIRIARRESGGPIAVVNDDVRVRADWLAPLVEALDDDRGLGAVQPALVFEDSVAVNSLGVDLDRYGAGSDRGLGQSIKHLGSASSIDVFTAGAVLFRRRFLEDTGGFDERYFLYYEDVDLALRGAERGWRYACVPTSTVAHAKGATTDETADDARRLQERNRIVVAARFFAPTTVGRALWMSVRRLRHQPHAAHLRALAGGLVRMPRAFVERRRAARNAADVETPTGGNAR